MRACVRVRVCVCVCVCDCMHVHSPHVGSALYMHGSTGINCRMFAPTTFNVFRRLCYIMPSGYIFIIAYADWLVTIIFVQ